MKRVTAAGTKRLAACRSVVSSTLQSLQGLGHKGRKVWAALLSGQTGDELTRRPCLRRRWGTGQLLVYFPAGTINAPNAFFVCMVFLKQKRRLPVAHVHFDIQRLTRKKRGGPVFRPAPFCSAVAHGICIS